MAYRYVYINMFLRVILDTYQFTKVPNIKYFEQAPDISLKVENNSLAMKTLDKNHGALHHLDTAIIEQVTDLGQDIQNSETCKNSVLRSNLELPVKIAMESGDNRNQLDEVCNFRK